MDEERKSLLEEEKYDRAINEGDADSSIISAIDDDDEPRKRSNRCGWIIAGIAVLALILLGVILFVLEEKHIKGGTNRYKLVDSELTPYSYKAVLEVPEKAKASKLPYPEDDHN